MQKLRIATFNIRCDTVSDGPNRWSQRKAAVLQFIKEKDWQIFGLQEVTPLQLKDLVHGLPEWQFCGSSRENSPESGEYNPIFYKKKDLELLNSETKWLAEMPDRPIKSWDASYLRIVTWGIFKRKDTGSYFSFINTHFDNDSEVARYYSAQQIQHSVKKLATPLILTGDFNAEPSERAIKQLEQDFVSIEKKNYRKYQGSDSTFHDYFRAKQTIKIDYIFISKTLNVCTAQTLTWQKSERQLSDHFPIEATISF